MTNQGQRRPVVITRKHGQQVVLEHRNTKIVVELRRCSGRTRLAITAPGSVHIYRAEVKERAP